MTRDPDVSWLESRLIPFSLGLLDESERTRFEELLETRPDCRLFFEESLQADGPGEAAGEHIPASVLARWPDVETTLRGADRIFARRHLERCGECRDVLRMLGHEPHLSEDPSREGEARAILGELVNGECLRESPATRSRRGATRPWKLGPRALAGKLVRALGRKRAVRPWTVAVPAAAGVFALVLALRPTADSPRQPAIAVPYLGVSFETTRGSSLELAPDRDAPTIVLALERPLDLDASRPATLTIENPAGHQVEDIAVDLSALARVPVTVLVPSASVTEPGTYRLTLRGARLSDGGRHSWTTEMRIRPGADGAER